MRVCTWWTVVGCSGCGCHTEPSNWAQAGWPAPLGLMRSCFLLNTAAPNCRRHTHTQKISDTIRTVNYYKWLWCVCASFRDHTQCTLIRDQRRGRRWNQKTSDNGRNREKEMGGGRVWAVRLSLFSWARSVSLLEHSHSLLHQWPILLQRSASRVSTINAPPSHTQEEIGQVSLTDWPRV